jgi:hypothetical protein
MHPTQPQPDNIFWHTIVFGLVPVYIYYHAPTSCPLALPVGNEHGATEVMIILHTHPYYSWLIPLQWPYGPSCKSGYSQNDSARVRDRNFIANYGR